MNPEPQPPTTGTDRNAATDEAGAPGARRPGPDIDGQPVVARVLAAGHAFNLPVGFFDPAGRAAYARDADRVTIEFTDAAGSRWRRRNNEPPECVITTPTH